MKRRQGYREEAHVKMEAEIGLMRPEAKDTWSHQ